MSGLQAGFLAAFLVLIGIFLFYKPARFSMLWINGVSCPDPLVCVEDEDREREAMALYNGAIRKLTPTLGDFLEPPRVIFCSTWDCYEDFGMTDYPAESYGDVATVIGPEGWETYHVAGALVHRWITQHIGWFRKLFLPVWLGEGMAYELSGDPRKLIEPFRGYKKQFREWYGPRRGRNLKLEIRTEATLF